MIELTFQDVLDTKKCFDASGIDNPNDYLWYLHKGVYYPIV
jgi:hypothetical protein